MISQNYDDYMLILYNFYTKLMYYVFIVVCVYRGKSMHLVIKTYTKGVVLIMNMRKPKANLDIVLTIA